MIIHGHNTGSIRQLAERLRDCNVALRWGGNQVAGAINGQAHLLDGLEQLHALAEANIKCPEFIVNPLWAVGQQPATPPPGMWLARKVNHTQGKDILVVGRVERGRRRWRASDFFVRYEPNVVREWRFHILNGESIARGLKIWAGRGAEPTTAPVIRSRRLGWHMRHDIDPPKGLRTLAKKAVETVGYDLGAVDLLELRDGTGMVLEVNSRPAIRDEYTLGRYERALRAL